MRLPRRLEHANPAWLRGSSVPDVPEMPPRSCTVACTEVTRATPGEHDRPLAREHARRGSSLGTTDGHACRNGLVKPVIPVRANGEGSCPLVAGGVELRRAPALEVRRSRLARDLPVAHSSRVARRAEGRSLALRAANTSVRGVGAVDGLPGAACAPAPPSTVVASGRMNTCRPPSTRAAARQRSSYGPSSRLAVRAEALDPLSDGLW